MTKAELFPKTRNEMAATLANSDRPAVQWAAPEHACTLHYLIFDNGVRYYRLLSVGEPDNDIHVANRYIFREDGRLGKVLRNQFVGEEVDADVTDYDAVKSHDEFQIKSGLAQPAEVDETTLDDLLRWATQNPDEVTETLPLPGGFI